MVEGNKKFIIAVKNVIEKLKVGLIYVFRVAHEKRRKVIRPLKEELAAMVTSMPMTKIAIKYNVSHHSVRKWCKSYGLDYKTGRGYWQKLHF